MSLPTATAGPNQVDVYGSLPRLTTLSGSGSPGPILEYEWTMLAVAKNSTADVGVNGSFTDGVASVPDPTFTCDRQGSYCLQLRVRNSQGWSDPDVDVQNAQTTIYIKTQKQSLYIPSAYEFAYDTYLNDTLYLLEDALSAITHNTLIGLQGGAALQYYHLTAAEYTTLQAGSWDHGSLLNLSHDDHTQYLLINGTRKMTGDLTFARRLPVTIQVESVAIGGNAEGGCLYLYAGGGDGAHVGGSVVLKAGITDDPLQYGQIIIGQSDTSLITLGTADPEIGFVQVMGYIRSNLTFEGADAHIISVETPATTHAGYALSLIAGAGYGAAQNGGTLYVRPGAPGSGGTYGNILLADLGGKVGIGGTPSYDLDLLNGRHLALHGGYFYLLNRGEARFYNSGDTNWGKILCPNTDGGADLAIYTGAGEALRIKNDGKVGVGTTGPRCKLDISAGGATGNTTLLALRTANGVGNNVSIDFNIDDADLPIGRISTQYYASGEVGLGLYTYLSGPGLTEKVRIDAYGRVGIGMGVTAPVAAYLETPGNLYSSCAKFGAFEIQSYAINNGWLGDNVYWDNGGSGFTRRATGYAALHYFTGGGWGIYTGPTGPAGAVAMTCHLGVNNSGYFGIGGDITNPNNYTGAWLSGMNGKIGIGTGNTEPSAKLHVVPATLASNGDTAVYVASTVAMGAVQVYGINSLVTVGDGTASGGTAISAQYTTTLSGTSNLPGAILALNSATNHTAAGTLAEQIEFQTGPAVTNSALSTALYHAKLRGVYVATGGSVTKQYGIYLNNFTTAGTNYGIYLDAEPNGGAIASAASVDITVMPGSGGYVGIGTVSPSTMLEVNGTVTIPDAATYKFASGHNISIIGGNLSINSVGSEVDIGGGCNLVGYGTAAFSKAGTVKANVDLLTLGSHANAADMDGTSGSILFRQKYYDAGSPTAVDAARITVGTEQDWTSVASTQDAYMAFSVALNGTVTEWMRLTSGGSLGVGTPSPSQKFEVSVDGAICLGAFSSWSNTASDHGSLYLLHGRGTNASPTAIQSGDALGALRFAGQYTSTRGNFTTAASIFGYAADVFTGAQSPAYLQFNTTPVGSLTPAEAMRILSTGFVGINATDPNGRLEVRDPTYPVIQATRMENSNNTESWALAISHRSTADMIDGFGAGLGFTIRDSAGINNTIAGVAARRAGADNTGDLYLYTYAAGVQVSPVIVKSTNKVGIGNTTAATTLHVYDSTAVTGSTTLKVQAGAGQSTTELLGIYANNGTTEYVQVSSAGVLTESYAAIATAQTIGLVCVNPTAAAAGAQQYSPMAALRGQGWKTDAGGASQPVEFSWQVIPTQGTANPGGILYLWDKMAAGSYEAALAISRADDVANFALLNVYGDVRLINNNAIGTRYFQIDGTAGDVGSHLAIKAQGGAAGMRGGYLYLDGGTSDTTIGDVQIAMVNAGPVKIGGSGITATATGGITVNPGASPASALFLDIAATAENTTRNSHILSFNAHYYPTGDADHYLTLRQYLVAFDTTGAFFETHGISSDGGIETTLYSVGYKAGDAQPAKLALGNFTDWTLGPAARTGSNGPGRNLFIRGGTAYDSGATAQAGGALHIIGGAAVNGGINGFVYIGDSTTGAVSIETANVLLPDINSGAGTYPLKWDTASGIVTYDTSDARQKINIEDYEAGLTELVELKPRRYTYRGATISDGEITFTTPGRERVGFLAQEVVDIIPEAVYRPEDEDNALWGMDYDSLIPVLVNAIKELDKEDKKLKLRIEELESHL